MTTMWLNVYAIVQAASRKDKREVYEFLLTPEATWNETAPTALAAKILERALQIANPSGFQGTRRSTSCTYSRRLENSLPGTMIQDRTSGKVCLCLSSGFVRFRSEISCHIGLKKRPG